MGREFQTGFYISGLGHGGLLLWVLVAGLFVAEDLPDIAVTDVSIISSQDFAAMQGASPDPDGSPVEAPPAPVQSPRPVPAPTPVVEATPDPVPDTQPTPDPAPDGILGDTVVAPDASPTPAPAPRVAPEAAPEPDPEVETSETLQAQTAPSQDADPLQEAQEQSAPEAATTQIVTEADQVQSGAPVRSPRPGRRPPPSAPAEPPAQVQPEPNTELAEPVPEPPIVPDLQDLINETVSEVAAASDVPEADVASGGITSPPLTRAEKSAFTLGINRCWNVGALGTDALAVSVVVGFSMEPDGRPNAGSIRKISSVGGGGDAVTRAYEAARRAIIRCGTRGYDVPLQKYDQWREVEVTFDASSQQIR